MKIAQLIQTVEPGGAEQLALSLSGAFAASGFETHLIVLDGSGVLANRRDSMVQFHDLGWRFQSGTRVNAVLYCRATRALQRILKKEKIDVLQTHLPFGNFLGLYLSLRGGARVYPTIHNNEEFSYGSSTNRLRQLLRKTAYGAMLHRTAGMLAVSSTVKTSMMKTLKIREDLERMIHVVPNGVPIPEMPTSAEQRNARKILGLPPTGTLFASVGRLSPQKNFGDLILAASHIPKDLSWHCALAGSGPQEQDLRAIIAEHGLGDRMTMLGFLSDPSLLYKAADILVMPSLWEGLPLVLLEAMAHGMPVVGYSVDGLGDVVTNGREGLLVSPGESDELGRAMNNLAQEPGRIRTMGNASRVLVEEKYSFKTLIATLVDIFNR